MFERLNLDDWGGERFDSKKVDARWDGKLMRARFELEHPWDRDRKRPFIWQTRLADWRRLESVYHRLNVRSGKAGTEYWDYARNIWKQTKKICGKEFESYYMQLLPAACKRKKREKLHLTNVHRSRDGYERRKINIAMSSDSGDRADPLNAKHVWIWLGSPEEEQFNILRRRQDETHHRTGLAHVAFEEAVKTRLFAWYNSSFSERERYMYRQQVFVAIENDGRSYGYLMASGALQPVWAPGQKPRLFV